MQKMNINWTWMIGAAACLLVVVSGCPDDGTGPRTDSESHFLSACGATSDCPSAYACVCNVCTVACEATAACESANSGSVCVSSDAPPADGLCVIGSAEVSGLCLSECLTTADCTEIGAGLTCDRGYCLPADDGPLDVGFDLSDMADAGVPNDAGTDGVTSDLEADGPDSLDTNDGADTLDASDAQSDLEEDSDANEDSDAADAGDAGDGVDAGLALLGQSCDGNEDCGDAMSCSVVYQICAPLCSAADTTCPEGSICEVPGDLAGLCLPECTRCGSSEGCSEDTICGYAQGLSTVAPEDTLICLPEAMAPSDLCVTETCDLSCGAQTCAAADDGCHCGTCDVGDGCFFDSCGPVGDCAGDPCTDAWGGLVCEGQQAYRTCPSDADAFQLCLCTGGEAGFTDGDCAETCVSF